MRKSHLFAGLGLLFVQLACGDDDTGDGPNPTSATLCAHLCARLHEAKCAGEAKTDCQATCVAQVDGTAAECKAAVNAFTTCAGRNMFTCDSASLASPPAACMQEMASWTACVAHTQQPQPQADAATPGQGSGPDSGPASGVVDAGATVHEPVGDAGPLNPGHLLEDASVPGDSDAGGLPQICRPALDDDACDTCGETSCCAELAGCDSECRTLGICVADCTDSTGSCIQACANAASQRALGQYNAILDCYDTSCSVQCGE